MRGRPAPPALRHSSGDSSGVAAVEFAILAPVLIVLLAGAANIGLATDHALQLGNAARGAAQYLTILPNDATGARAAAQAVLPGAAVTVSAMVCTCPPSAASATGGSAVSCTTGACAAGIGMTRSVSVTVTMASPSIPGLAFAGSPTANRSVTVRVQ